MSKKKTVYDFTYDEWQDLSEEEQDEYFRPKKSNKTKSLLPLLVYLILQKFSNEERPLSQAKIIEYLDVLYGVEVERKAVGRAIHALEDLNLGVYNGGKQGCYYR